MKALPRILIFSAILAAIAGCGKNNESGKSSSVNTGICAQYGVNGVCNSYTTGTYISGNNINVSALMSQIPCELSGTVNRTQQTITVQTATLAQTGQSYLGVTSLGDVAIVVGNGSMTAQMTVFLCPGQTIGQLTGPVLLGEYTSVACPIQTITAATLVGYNGIATRFRDPRFGRGNGQPFQFCHQ